MRKLTLATLTLHVLVSSVIAVFMSFNAYAATIHVPADYKTIQAGIDAASDGDTVLVANGTYVENINFSGKNIVVKSNSEARFTTIKPANNSIPAVWFHSAETSDAQLICFTIRDGGNFRGSAIKSQGHSKPTIENCIITNSSGEAAIAFYYSGATLRNCLIYDNHSSRVFFWSPTDYTVQIINCTIANNTGWIGNNNQPVESVYKNCIIYNNGNVGEFGNVSITYSLVEGGWLGENNIDEDPLFVDPEGGDYHLQTDSQCIDTGTANGAPSEDIEGNPRPHGDGIDMGAYEFQGLVSPKPSIVVSPDSIDLGDVIVGRQYVVTFGIGNDGDADLNVTNITHDLGDDLMIDPNPPYEPPLTVAPDDTTTVTLTFTVSVEGEINEALSVVSNDATSPTEIDISAVAKILVGDLSGDGSVSAYDASLILQFVVGLITDFPIESMMVTSPSDIEPRNYEISIPDVTVKPGEKVYVPIVVNDAKGLTGGGIVVKYDSSILKAIDTMPTSILSNSYWECNIKQDKEVRFAFASMKPIESGDRLIILEFEVSPNTEGITSPLTLDYVKLSESLSITKKNGSVSVLPSRSMLLQNYPNPFNPETWIPFQLSDDAKVIVSIYDVEGQLVRKIGLGEVSAGMYLNKDKAVYWDGCNNAGEQISSGLYFYQLQAGEYSKTKRMLIMK